MKKYIKIYDDENKQMRRLPIITDLSVDVHLYSDKCQVRFCDKQTGKYPFAVVLSIGHKKLEKFCEDLITCRMSKSIEVYMRWTVEKAYHTFLTDTHRAWPLNKFAKKWELELNLVLGITCLKEGYNVAQLAPLAKEIFGK